MQGVVVGVADERRVLDVVGPVVGGELLGQGLELGFRLGAVEILGRRSP